MRLLPIASSIVLLLAVGACGEVVGSGGGPDGPTIASISPDHGPLGGGVTVTVTGTGFADAGDPIVVLGGYIATGVTVVSDTSLTFVAPAGDTEGARGDVTVSNQNGFATLAASYRFNELPIVIAVDPPLVAGAGGTDFTITGRGFEELEAGDATVTIGGVEATDVQVVDDQTIMATSGAAPAIDPFSEVDLVVSNANGDATGSDPMKYTGPGLLAVERRCCSGRTRLWYVRPSDGYTAEVGNTSGAVHACATSPTGQVFVLTRGGNGHRLGTLDVPTGAVTPIADLRDGGGTARYAQAMTFVGAGLFGYDGRSDSRLMTINPGTGLITFLGAVTGQNRQCAIGQRDASSVVFVDSDCETMDSINTATGVLTAGPALGGSPCSQHRGIATVGGTTYLAEYNGQKRVYTLNTTTGARAEVARLPFSISGLCATPAGF